MVAAARIETHILTGFLGSGKTTLLNRLLASQAFADTAVIVNELGDIALDHLLVAERTDQIAVLEGGCLCCAVIDSLPETLLELCRKRSAGELPPFARIVIETTGLADPGPIIEVIRRSPLLSHFLSPGLIVTALDMETAPQVPERHPEAMRQLVLADRMVLTKLDLRGPETAVERAHLTRINPLAEIVTKAEVEAEPARLVAPIHSDQVRPAVPEEDHPRHSHGVRAWSFPIEPVVSRAGLAAFAEALRHGLGDGLLRCKGIVQSVRGPLLIQGVGPRFSFSDAPHVDSALAPHVTCIVQHRDREDVARLLSWLYIPEGTLPPTPQEIQ